ncbi:MAG: hypothetical protein ACOCSE_06370 [Chitinivibrionales bacterium]
MSELEDTGDPDEVYGYFKETYSDYLSSDELGFIYSVFRDVIDLFNGDYPGYRACNLLYHDRQHTMDVFLSMVRLTHGFILSGDAPELRSDHVVTGLVAALFHDTGYIQKSSDTSGTGAKYTKVHVRRSADFASNYLKDKGWSWDWIERCADIIMCTDLGLTPDKIDFKDHCSKTMGALLGTADLMGQMSDRAYLEKLVYLYSEFVEGRVSKETSEFEMFENTLNFFEVMDERIKKDFGGMNRYFIPHFKFKYGIERDLYSEAVEANRRYLQYILKKPRKELIEYLRRDEVVNNILREIPDMY